MAPCIDEEAILAFCRGSIAPELRSRVEEHIAECDECRALVSAVARSSLVESKEIVRDFALAATTPAGALGSRIRRSSPVSAPVHAGDLLAGKYSVERVLGAGGMGVVVAARHMQLGQLVALKFLLPAACEAPGATERFLREGQAAARITSEHVARVSDTGVLENGSPYLVMEYLDGDDLAALAAQRGPLPPSEAVEYVLQACEAIVEAHQLGIVHRDLKPSNLFLSHRKDGSPVVKVLDFGISKTEGGSHTQLTSTSILMGSPRYMSPEQMVSAKHVDQRTDVWALGVILFELVTGKPVWHADTVQGLCAQIASVPAPLLRQLAPEAPPILEDVVARCLAKSPEQRMPSVADLALALAPVAPETAQTSIERILGIAGRSRGSPPARSLPSTVVSKPRRPSSRRLVGALSATIGALVVAGMVIRPSFIARRRVEPRATESVAEPIPAASVMPAAFAPPHPTSPPAAEPAPATPAAAVATTAPAAKAPAKAPPPSAPRTAPFPNKPPRSASATAPDPPSPSPLPTPAETPNRALSDRK